MNSLAQLTDASLHSETKRLVGSTNALTAQLLAHLGEVEARGIHRERACSSLYTYCVYELRMSEDEAQRRCRAARLARQFPILLEMLAEASLHLTGILLLGPHLTDANCAELLARARFRTKREIERLVAEIAPCQDVPSRIVPLHRAGDAGAEYWMISPLDDVPRPRNTWAAYVQALAGEVREMQAGLGAGRAPPRGPDDGGAAETGGPQANAPAPDGEKGVCTPAMNERRDERRDEPTAAASAPHLASPQEVSTPVPGGTAQPTAPVLPIAEPRYKVQFTADQAYIELLEEARNLLQHELPTRDIVAVHRRALELLVHKLRQRKYAASERPRSKAPERASGNVQPQTKPTPARPPVQQSATRAPSAVPRSTRTRHSAPPSQPGATPSAPQSRIRSEPRPATHSHHSPPQTANHSRYIPAEVRRSVWQRDEARCAYVDDRGQRCREQSGLEFHHQHPHARRGPATIGNLALRCRAHNGLAAEQDFGRDFIRKRRAHVATPPESTRAGAGP